MPWQFIYTSTPAGLTPGRSGFCVVARHRAIPERLVAGLERASRYEPQAGRPVIFTFWHLATGGAPHGVITRCCDAGLDHTSRRNYLAHHLIFAPAEMTALPPPAEIARRWNGWRETWRAAPQWLDSDTPEDLPPHLRTAETSLPAATWARLAADAGNAALLCPERAPADTLLDVSDSPAAAGADGILRLFAESSLLLRGGAWAAPFTTHAQPGDRAAGILWRAASGIAATQEALNTRNTVRPASLARATESTAAIRLAREGVPAAAVSGKTAPAPPPSAIAKPPPPPAAAAPPPPPFSATTAPPPSVLKIPANAPKTLPPPPQLRARLATPPNSNRDRAANKHDANANAAAADDRDNRDHHDSTPDASRAADTADRPPTRTATFDPDIRPDDPLETAAAARRSRRIRTAIVISTAASFAILIVAAAILFLTDDPGHPPRPPPPPSTAPAPLAPPRPPANITPGAVEKAYGTSLLARELADARWKSRWDEAARLWLQLQKTDPERAAEIREGNLPAIQKELPAFAIKLVETRLKELGELAVKPPVPAGEIQKAFAEVDATRQLLKDIGATPDADERRHLDTARLRVEILATLPAAPAGIHHWEPLANAAQEKIEITRSSNWPKFLKDNRTAKNLRFEYLVFDKHADISGATPRWQDTGATVAIGGGGRRSEPPFAEMRLGEKRAPRLTLHADGSRIWLTRTHPVPAADITPFETALAARKNIALSLVETAAPAERCPLILYSPDTPPAPFKLPRDILKNEGTRIQIPLQLHNEFSRYSPADSRLVLLPATERPFARHYFYDHSRKRRPPDLWCNIETIQQARQDEHNRLRGELDGTRKKIEDAERTHVTASPASRAAIDETIASQKRRLAELEKEIAVLDTRLKSPPADIKAISSPWFLLFVSNATGATLPIAVFE